MKNNVNKLPIFLILIFFYGQSILAQPFVKVDSIFPEHYYNENDHNCFLDIDWGDFDNDGDLDFLYLTNVFNANPLLIKYTLDIYENLGEGKFSKLTTLTDTAHIISWLDYNNDGLLDIVGISGLGFNSTNDCRLFKNNGDKTFTKIIGHNLPENATGEIDAGDINNDGNIDLIYSGFYKGNDYTYLLANIGDGTFQEITNTSIPNISHSGSINFGDFNKDGYLDLLISGSSSEGCFTKVYKNNGDKTFSEIDFTFSIIPDNIGRRSQWGDIDNDGDLDIVEAGNQNINIYNNNSSGSFEEDFDQITDTVISNIVSLADYDHDDDIDIMTSGSGNLQEGDTTVVLKVFKNDGNGSFSEALELIVPNTLYHYNSNCQWLDFDNDGDLDIFANGELYSNETSTQITKPDFPSNLESMVDSNTIVLSWNALQDEFASDLPLSYNLRVGTSPGGIDIVSPQSADNGYRKIPEPGNACLDTFLILHNIPAGNYYWSVQAVNGGFIGGPFAIESTFQVEEWVGIPLVNNASRMVYPNPSHDIITIKQQDFYKLKIVNLQGKIVITSFDKTNNISHLKKGVYILHIETHNNEFIKKLIKN